MPPNFEAYCKRLEPGSTSKEERNMANEPKLELHASDFQLFGSLDSASLPSEPPDIRNWFSSYVYESNSLDGFQDFDASARIFTEEENKAKLDDIRVIDKIITGLSARKVESLDRIVKCNETDALEHSKHADVVLGLSDSLPLSSDGFIFSDYKEIIESKAGIADLAGHSGISEVVKCIDLVKGSKQTYQSDSMDGQKLEPHRIPHELNEQASERISQHMFPERKTQAHSHDSVEEYKNINTYDIENNAKSDTTFMRSTIQSHVVGNVENYAGGQEGNYCPSIKTKVNAKKSLSKEGNLGKENPGTAFQENGFVSTRKSGERANIMNFTEPQRVQFQSRRKGVKHGPDHVVSTNTRINVLSETANFHLTKGLGITGKWRCPQRNKLNLGPPLKQVRLEQWVRRV